MLIAQEFDARIFTSQRLHDSDRPVTRVVVANQQFPVLMGLPADAFNLSADILLPVECREDNRHLRPWGIAFSNSLLHRSDRVAALGVYHNRLLSMSGQSADGGHKLPGLNLMSLGDNPTSTTETTEPRHTYERGEG